MTIQITRINLKNDTAIGYLFYFVPFSYKFEKTVFDLNKIPANKIKLFYKDLIDEWDKKYRV